MAFVGILSTQLLVDQIDPELPRRTSRSVVVPIAYRTAHRFNPNTHCP